MSVSSDGRAFYYMRAGGSSRGLGGMASQKRPRFGGERTVDDKEERRRRVLLNIPRAADKREPQHATC